MTHLAVYQTDVQRLVRFFLWSIVCLAIGIGLSGGTLHDGPMPLNKNLWTLSFSFFNGEQHSSLIHDDLFFDF